MDMMILIQAKLNLNSVFLYCIYYDDTNPSKSKPQLSVSILFPILRNTALQQTQER